jgi:hypothetical protein
MSVRVYMIKVMDDKIWLDGKRKIACGTNLVPRAFELTSRSQLKGPGDEVGVVLLIWWLVQSEIWRTTLICNLNWFCSEITSGLVMFWKCVVFALCLFLYSTLSAEWKTMSRMQLAKRKQHSIDVHVVCSYLMPFFLSKSCARNIVLFYMILLSYIMYRT